MTAGRFTVVHERGDAKSLHRFTPPGEPVPTIVIAEVTGPALVLGSAQAEGDADPARAGLGGYTIVRRRSGGGSVWLAPGAQRWIDVWIPAGDPLWRDDVIAAAQPIGAAWRAALTALGIEDLRVHDGGLVAARWSGLVCFAGVGPGEVVDGAGRKWVGLSQRRTRDWTRVQTMVHRVWDPVAALDGLALDPSDRTQAGRDLGDAVGRLGDLDPIPGLIAALG